MEFEEFSTEFFTELKAKNKNCLLKLDSKRELIQAHLGENANSETIQNYVEKINDIILQSKKKFSIIEKALKKDYFTNVYTSWKDSDVLIKACKEEKKEAIRWLLTMDINLSVQDEEGKTALMYAVKNPHLLIAVKLLCSRCVNLNSVDKNGENALFYALHNKDALNELLRNKINVNQINNNNESALLYCCKNDIFKPIKYLTNRRDLDVNLTDKEERTAAMYLAEKARNTELRLLERRHCNFNYVNSKRESVLSLVINKMYDPKEKCPTELYSEYLRIIISLIHFNCDFNVPVDEDGNTAIMVFMLIPDYYTLQYVLKKNDDIDFSVKNKYGESASSLCKKCTNKHDVFKFITENPTYISSDNKKLTSEEVNVKVTEENVEPIINNRYDKFEMTKSMEKVAKKVYYECDKYYDPRNELYRTYHVDEMSYWVFA